MALSLRTSHDRCTYLERLNANLDGLDHLFDCARFETASTCSADVDAAALASRKNLSRGPICAGGGISAIVEAENELRGVQRRRTMPPRWCVGAGEQSR